MSTSNPQWTSELTNTFVKGEDQLGIEGAAQGYQQWLIPGIITTTDRARYYSFYAWVLYRFIQSAESTRLLNDFRGQYYKRHEMAMILGAYSHHKDLEVIGGLVGSGRNNSKVRNWWSATGPVSLDLDYFKNNLGGLGQYYLTAMQAMGIIGTSENPSWVFQITERGVKLANAFQQSIASTAYSKNLEKHNELSELTHRDALEYGKVGCICPDALAKGEDLQLLKDAFFRFEQSDPDHPHSRRRMALAVMLDLVHSAGGKYKREYLRPALYLNEYAAGMNYTPSSELTEWVARWRMVAVRHQYTFGLQSLWAAFLMQLAKSEGGYSIPEFFDWLKETLGESVWNQPLKGYLNHLCAAVGLDGDWNNCHEEFDGTCKQSTGLDEFTAYQHSIQSKTDAGALIAQGVAILASLFLRFYGQHDKGGALWQEMAPRERLSLTSYFQFTVSRSEKGIVTLGSWLSDLYREFIWAQHEFIALEKLRFQGYDTFKFMLREGKFYWPFYSLDSYNEPVRFSANRLNNALSILIDLGMIDRDEQDNLYLSDEGNSYLTRCREMVRLGH